MTAGTRTPNIARIAYLLALATLVPGCLQGAAAPRATAIPKATFSDETGGIEGYVVDPEQVPIFNATVRVVGINRTYATTAAGAFAIDALTPQTYVVIVQHDGFFKKELPVTVPTGAVKKVLVVLEPVPPPAQYLEDGYTYAGQLAVGACVATTCSSGVALAQLPEAVKSSYASQMVVTGANWQSILYELAWTPATALASQAQINLKVPTLQGTTGSCALFRDWSIAKGTSPLRVWLNRTEHDAKRLEDSSVCPVVPAKGYQSQIQFAVSGATGAVPASAYVQQKFTVYGTISYNVPLDPSYTRLEPGP